MDRRFDQRWPTHIEARVAEVKNLGNSWSGYVADVSESGVCVTLPFQLAPGNTVQLEFADCLLFGTVVYARPEGSSFRTGIELVRVLLGGSDLSRLLQSIMRETMPAVPGLEPSETHLG